MPAADPAVVTKFVDQVEQIVVIEFRAVGHTGDIPGSSVLNWPDTCGFHCEVTCVEGSEFEERLGSALEEFAKHFERSMLTTSPAEKPN